MNTNQLRLVGNRLALAGAILYLLEWVAILGFNSGNVPAAHGAKQADIVAIYANHGTGIALDAAWFSLVLLGRILFVAGIRDGLRRSGAQTLWLDFSLAAMAASVVIEISAYAVAAGAAQAVAAGADVSTIVGIDAVANWLDMVIFAPFAVSVLTASLGMLSSRLFPAWICWLGLATGVVGCIGGLVLGPGFLVGGSLYKASQPFAFAVFAAWIWMIGTAIVLFRAAGRQRT